MARILLWLIRSIFATATVITCEAAPKPSCAPTASDSMPVHATEATESDIMSLVAEAAREPLQGLLHSLELFVLHCAGPQPATGEAMQDVLEQLDGHLQQAQNYVTMETILHMVRMRVASQLPAESLEPAFQRVALLYQKQKGWGHTL